ncbi:hypothetical protein SERLA73DRAFT_161377 [Serpula lacrymans var. lacrymans S7.3]|uniref:Carrier domain-containing protein n=1 Tax=Serpula lacrymans var. lacrymans (strain S7.3) TaxID=936435 RepID=F8Q212_SERL3|nr:hypothetical protein SERLA73DRAFT_161377 [Serpula lacrymans var. lacrymans S7.3]
MIPPHNTAHFDTYWRPLLKDFSKVALGEDATSRLFDTSCHLSLSASSTVLDPTRLRQAALIAWSFVLSRHAGVDDVIVAELCKTNHVVALVPRRVQLASAAAPCDQILSQIEYRAPFAWERADELGLSGVYGFIETSCSESIPAQSLPLRKDDSALHLSVLFSPASSAISLSLAFSSSSFHKNDARYILQHLSFALHQLLDDPAILCDDIEMMSPQEHQFTKCLPSLVDVNGLTHPEDPTRYSFAQDLLRRQVISRPESVAIVWQGEPLYTYASLDSASTKLAYYLTKNHAIGPGDVVVIFSEHSPFVIVAMYALLKAGAAYLPIDVEAPDAIIRHAVNMVDSKLLLTLDSLHPKLAALSLERSIVSLDKEEQLWLGVPQEHLDQYRPVLGDPHTTLAYVNLTSGSTGLPKGCMISHSNLVNWIVEATPGYGRTSETRTLQICKLQFDGITEEIFMTLYQGGTLCMAPPQAIEANLKDVVNSMQVTMLTLTPTRASLLDPAELPSLSVLVMTGEPLRHHARERWIEAGKTVCNAFGPTETICCFMLENPVRSSESNETPCGLTLNKTTRVYCLNPSLESVPVGCVGEICISGPTVGMGYFGNVEKSQEAYVTDPFRKEYRMYRTGDLGRLNHEGRLLFVGRRDQQIKLNGNRIELGGIEAVLQAGQSTWSTCADIVTFRGSSRLAAFLALKSVIGSHHDMSLALTSDSKLEAARLSEFCATKLHKSMVPTLWIPVEAFPHTISGKLNRKAIKQFFHELSEEDTDAVGDLLVTRAEIVQPTSSVEKELQAIWSSCLKVPLHRVGIHNSLFDLGADSLGTLRLAAILGKAGFRVTPIELRKLQTIAQVALALTSQSSEPARVVARPLPLLSIKSAAMDNELRLHGIAIDDVDAVIPATPFQKGVLLHPTDTQDGFMSTMHFAITQNIDREKFVEVLDSLKARHPILRTAFLMTAAHSIVQVVLKQGPSVTVVKGDHFDPVAGYQWGRVAFNFTLVCNSEGPSELIIVAHHALFDGWSIRLLLSDLMKEYSGHLTLRPSWHNFVAYAGAADTEASIAFWREYLQGVQPTKFCKPKSLPDSGVGSVSRSFDIDLAQSSQKLQVMDSVLMDAAWSFVQFLHSNDEDVVFNLISSGRDVPVEGVMDMIGPCLTHYPLRINFSKITTIKALVEAVQDVLFTTHGHGIVGTGAIVKASGSSTRAALSNVDFVFQAIDSVFEISQEEMWIHHKVSNLDSATPLTIQVQTSPGHAGFKVSASHDRSAVSSEEVACMLDRFGQFVKLALTQPETELAAANFMISGEIEQVIMKNPDAGLQSLALVMFTSHVRERPHDLAVEMDRDTSLTYFELDAHSSAYASKLLSMRLDRDKPVLVHLEKGLALVVTVLACFKAGVCFCMISPDCPTGRMQIIIEDIKPQLVISPKPAANYPVPVLSPVSVGRICSYYASPYKPPLFPGSLAWIMMTSGTTGRPKPIGFSRSNLDAFTSGDHSHRERRRCLNFASVHFDASMEDFFTTLTQGGCLCLASDASLREDLPGVIRRMRIQVASLTPTVAKLLIGEQFETLETLMLGGEAYSPQLRDCLLATGISKLQSGYGPSECTVKCFMDVMAPGIPFYRPTTLGKVFGHNAVVVLDDKLRPVPFGAAGELFISGPQVSTGYVGQPDKTAQAFVTIDLPRGNQTRWYRSGDMVRLLPTRTVEFLGRKDRQVKIRGQRIELSDIETCILEVCPSIAQAAVIPVTDATEAQILVSFVVMKGDAWLNVSEVLGRLRHRTVVTPTEIIIVHRLPINASGKLDVPSLQNLYTEHQKRSRAETPPNETCAAAPEEPKPCSSLSTHETLVRTLWAGVLNIDESAIGIDDSFSDVGGDSFKWMQLSQAFVRAKIRTALKNLIAAGTVRNQALLIPK